MPSVILQLAEQHPINVRTASRTRSVELAERILELLDQDTWTEYDRAAALEIAQTLYMLPRQPIAGPRPVDSRRSVQSRR